MSIIIPLLEKLVTSQPLTADEMHAAVGEIMDGLTGEAEIASLLTALRMQGETIDEIAGAARAMRERVTRIPTTRTGLLDTCGTGGDQLHTFNISTATALVVAAAGVPVAKHGNRGVSSSSGSADVLEQLGVRIDLTPEQVSKCLDEIGIGFCFAPLLHGAMKHVAPVRKRLKFRTIFNLLGPLTNPAGAEFQLLGASRPDIAEKLAGALQRLGTHHAFVVSGADGLDEVSLWGRTVVFEIRGTSVSRHEWSAASFGLPECDVSQLQVGSPTESANAIRGIFAGQSGPARNIVLANAAAALLVAGRCTDLPAGVRLADDAIDHDHASGLLSKLTTLTKSVGA
ncbi:MAG: anthranilate phosphoribosyltransferase [Planctomycetales bacterium]|nr:anthranilate phosphoribosyltransferase [Planctomycetales bacterium]